MDWLSSIIGTPQDYQNLPGYNMLGQMLQPAQPAAPGPAPTPVSDVASPLAGGGIDPRRLPEAIAAHAARAGIGPEVLAPMQGATDDRLGAALNPNPGMSGIGGEVARDAEQRMLPPTAAPAMGQAPGQAAARGTNPFRGLSAPTAPQPQRVATPPGPATGQRGGIKGGDLIALLTALGAAGGGAPKLATLGSVLGR